MPKFNLYNIAKEYEEELITKLESVGLSKTGEKAIEGFQLSFYLSVEPEPVDIWWAEVYEAYLGDREKPKNQAHYAVFLISGPEVLYAVSMGKSHFYLKDFCNPDFGVNLAERIADQDHLKLKNSKLFGGKRSKLITSYSENAGFEYDSGESIHYVKAKTIDKDQWGEVASFGNSAQLSLDVEPDDLPQLVARIENELNKEPRIHLPRATMITDARTITTLDQKLTQAIMSQSTAALQPAEATISGVDFIFIDKNYYRFIWHGSYKDIEGDLNLGDLREFITVNNIDLANNLDEIKVRVRDEFNKGYTKDVKYFPDYVDDQRHFLLDGKWHRFNQNYIQYLKDQVDERITKEASPIHFSQSAFTDWENSLSDEARRSCGYPEYYFNSLMEAEGYINCDRNVTILQQYRIEKLDLYKDGDVCFVKIGTPQKLSYVVDQAIATLKVLQNKVDSILIDDHEIIPKRMVLWLIVDRQSHISNISDIKSLILLMKLSEWQRQCINARYIPIVRIGYKMA